jgi:hypothetical protein
LFQTRAYIYKVNSMKKLMKKMFFLTKYNKNKHELRCSRDYLNCMASDFFTFFSFLRKQYLYCGSWNQRAMCTRVNGASGFPSGIYDRTKTVRLVYSMHELNQRWSFSFMIFSNSNLIHVGQSIIQTCIENCIWYCNSKIFLKYF